MNYRILWRPVVFAAALATASCHGTGDFTPNNALPARPSGAYAYVGYDGSGQSIATGWFSVWPAPDPSGALGEWHFRRLAAGVATGHVFGDGLLYPTGRVTIPELYVVDLVPFVFKPEPAFAAREWSIETVTAGPLPDAFKGTWRYWAGGRETASGPFDADRNPGSP